MSSSPVSHPCVDSPSPADVGGQGELVPGVPGLPMLAEQETGWAWSWVGGHRGAQAGLHFSLKEENTHHGEEAVLVCLQC